MYRDTLTHSTLPTCTRSGAAKSTPTVNGTGGWGVLGGANNVNLFIVASSFLTRFSLLQVTV